MKLLKMGFCTFIIAMSIFGNIPLFAESDVVEAEEIVVVDNVIVYSKESPATGIDEELSYKVVKDAEGNYKKVYHLIGVRLNDKPKQFNTGATAAQGKLTAIEDIFKRNVYARHSLVG